MPGRRRPNRRAIKRYRAYTVDEAARALGVSKGTIRRWLNMDSLPTVDDRRPVLILGRVLLAFLDARSRPRARCGPAELYCVKCRAPRAAAGAMADFMPMTPTSGNLEAICEKCGTLMHRAVSSRQLEAFETILDVSIREAPRRIGDTASSSPSEHFEQEPHDHS